MPRLDYRQLKKLSDDMLNIETCTNVEAGWIPTNDVGERVYFHRLDGTVTVAVDDNL